MSKIDEFDKAGKTSGYAANRLLFQWLSDDRERVDLYAHLLAHRPVLKFQSRADTKTSPEQKSQFRQEAYLLTAKADVVSALTDAATFSNSPYEALGSGTFMLALDAGDHEQQKDFAIAYLKYDPRTVLALSTIAFKAGAVLPLKQRQFDLVNLAEQVALRFVGFLFGFAQADHPLIEATMRKAYLGLNYQILGRHFVSEPGIIPDAAVGMGALLERVAYLIDLYRQPVGREQQDEFDAIDAELKELRAIKDQNDKQPLEELDFVPVLKRIADQGAPGADTKFSGNELAVMVVGLIAGTIGNVQASVSIAIDEFLNSRCHDKWKGPQDDARRAWVASHDAAADPELEGLIWEALRSQPPVAFLPRKTIKAVTLSKTPIPEKAIVILAIGGATRDGLDDGGKFKEKPDQQRKDLYPLIFGAAPGPAGALHQCLGRHLAMPLITHIVRQVLLLPGLSQSTDPLTGDPVRLKKLWGFNCQSYPLEFNRFAILKQSPLIVVMNVRMPIAEHAEALKQVIKYGAPRIEKKLGDSGHVHFAQFLLIENDTKLVLFTIYDRDFDSYIEHFALQIGPLFDRIFRHIQDPPPMPVDKFPKEFVDTIRRHNAHPVGDYFFSAYPQSDVSMIKADFTKRKS